MSDVSQGDGWWIASDGKWYPPELHPDAQPPAAPEPSTAESPSADVAPFDNESVDGAHPSSIDPVDPVAPVVPTEARAAETLAMPAMTQPPAGYPSGPPIAEPAPVAAPGAAATTEGEYEFVTPADTASSAESPDRRGLLLGLAAVLLLVAVGFIGWRLLRGGSGGATSPEAAVEQLIASISEGDAVGLAEIFDPDEVEAWVGSFAPATETLAEITSGDPSLNAGYGDFAEAIYEAIDIDVTAPDGGELTFSVTELDRDNGRVARVRSDGVQITLTTSNERGTAFVVGTPTDTVAIDLDSIDGSSLTVTDRGGGLELSAFVPDVDTVDEFVDGVHLDLVTVEKDGGWYISIGYTVLENIRNAPGVRMAAPDYGRAYRLVDSDEGGADSAEQAIRDLVTALEELDYDAAIRLTDPLGLPYLHDYQSAIDREVSPGELRDAARELDLRVDTLDLTTSAWNDRTVVEVGQIAGSVAGGSFELDTRTWCAEAIDPDGERVSGCADEAIEEFLYEIGVFDTDPRDLIPDGFGLVAIERNGRWYFDPLGTLGYWADEIYQVAGDLDFYETIDSATGVETFDAFVALQAPVVSNGQTVSADPVGGYGAVALDLDGLDQPELDTFDPMRVGLARVDSDGNAIFPSFFVDEEYTASTEEWVVVYSAEVEGPRTYPATVLATESPISVSLEPVEIQLVDDTGFDGAIGDDGRPILLRFVEGLDVEFNGDAVYDTVSSWESEGTVHRGAPWAQNYGDPTFGAFAVVMGDPGDSFSVQVYEPFEPDPTDEPDPADEPDPFDEPLEDFGDDRVDRFSELVAEMGFEFAFDLSGGYFDGCGPNDPTATTYAFENEAFDLVLITTYSSEAAAQSAFIDLTELSSPCEDFPGLVIDDVEVSPGEELTVVLNTDSGDNQSFEFYARRGDTIVAATALTRQDLLVGWEAVATWGG